MSAVEPIFKYFVGQIVFDTLRGGGDMKGTPPHPELKTLEWWISALMLNPNLFLISRLNMACSPHEFNLQKSQQIGIKDITF